MRTFKFRTIAAIVSLLTVHIAGFAAMLMLLNSVQDSVTDLNSSGGLLDLMGGCREDATTQVLKQTPKQCHGTELNRMAVAGSIS